MDGFDLDRDLERLRSAAERIGANLVELDQDPTRALLDAADLRGDSAARWERARLAIGELFQSYAALTALLDRAAAVRGARPNVPASREAELAALLTGPSIELSDTEVPLAQRDLLSGSRAIVRCTPDELVSRMADSFAEVRAMVAAAGEVWGDLVPRLRSCRERLAGLTELANDPDGQMPAGLVGLGDELDTLSQAALTDPLSCGPDQLARIEAHLESSADQLAELHAAKDELPNRIEAARALLARVRQAIADGEQAAEVTAEKIVGRDAPMPLTLAPGVGERLEQITQRSERGAWRSAAAELARWSETTEDLLRRADEVTTAHHRLLDERTELRGRLDAFHAKAAHLGRLEQPELAALYEQARTDLHTAPTDLDQAGALVRRYQEALAAADDIRRVAR